MRAALLRVTVVTVLVLAGCGTAPDDGVPPAAPATSEPPPSPSPRLAEKPSTTRPTPPASTPTEESFQELPPELAARMPPDEEIDGMVLEAQAAYAAHRVVYDAAARTGFSDPALVEELVATAAGHTLDALQREAAAISAADRVVDGRAEILGMELYSLVVPDEDGGGLGVVLEVCLLIEGTLEESDGTVVLELGGEPIYTHVRLVDHSGAWLLVSQHVQEDSCPPALSAP